jgi:acid stress-induced BolA-like protein IbaG/YrbA
LISVLSAEQLKSYIVAGLACDYIQVLGDDGTHFEATIVAPAFEGKRMVAHIKWYMPRWASACAQRYMRWV